jgi:hypothetical protein
MTKSKKQRMKEASALHEKQKLFVLAAAVATILIIVFALAG